MEGLKKKRAIIKSALTRFSNYLETFTPLSDIEDLQSRLDKAIPLLDKFETLQEEIESYDGIDLDETVRTREEFEREKHLREEEEIKLFEDSYHKAIGKAKGFIKSRQSIVPSAGTVSRSHSESPAFQSETGPIGVSLPKLVLPTFDGTVSNWIKFRDTFKSLIHEHTGLSNIQKFHYLNSALIGDAARTIEALGVSEANYILAWEGLKSRYEDPNTLIHHHVQALFEAPGLARDSSHSELRQLLDNTNNHLLALRTLGKRTEFWDPLIIYLLTSKLNIPMKREWGRTLANSTTEPTFKEFANFLEKHIKFLQNSDLDRMKFNDIKINKATVKPVTTKPKQIKTYTTVTNKKLCVICNGAHPIYTCEIFKGMSTVTRLQKIRELHLCFNCLGDGHRNRDCTFGPCRKCGKKHNSLIHLEGSGTNTSGSLQVQVTGAQSEGLPQVENSIEPNESTSGHSNAIKQSLTARVIQKGTKVTVLSTAKLYIYDCHGQRHECRALLDSGSEPHIMTTALCNRLGLPKTKSNLELTGIEQGSLHANHLATTKISSRITNFSATITCVILDKISSNIPSTHINTTDVQIPKELELADPDYNCSGPVDLIIGASLFLRLLSVGQISIKNTELILHKTVLGWIIAGNICLNSPRKLICNLVKNQDLNDQLERFWRLEHCFIPVDSTTKGKKDYSEQHFIDTTERDETGRFVVSIPFKDNASELGNSLAGAEKRFHAVERKLSRNPELKEQYTAFMEEYEALGHMSEISLSKYIDTSHFYLPHHAVIKEGSTTTKLRVVFDGSAKTSSGLSLNDVQYVGPTVQDDLFTILLRFRKYSIVLSADIAKMYRQIKIKAQDRAYQLILWRSNTDAPIKYYELNTVTYGTASAPFLATRCLRQLSDELKNENPVISQVIRHDFYVDDLLTGAENIEDALKIKNNLMNILSSAGFELRKWASNDSRLQTESKNTTKEVIPLLDKDPKTLGLFWDSVTDTLRYSVKYSDQNKTTKRGITSIIAQIFDPLGLVGPTIIKAKIILQKLWELQVDWDESLPQELHTLWQTVYKQLKDINNITIQRHVIGKNARQLQFHGFCDASESAYGACIYIRTQSRNKITVRLLCAKSRVAPLKATTLPRLELSGALLLAQLAQKVSQAYDLNADQWYYWTDSTIVLSWIRAPSNRWKTFVANRIAEIQELTNDNWNHVESSMNPADLISRGMDAADLLQAEIWWKGPAYLSQEENKWPVNEGLQLLNAPEQRHKILSIQTKETQNKQDQTIVLNSGFFDRFSSFTRLVRVTAWILRFYKNCKLMITEGQRILSKETHNKDDDSKRHQFLKTDELKLATRRLVKLAQAEDFSKEINDLAKGTTILNCRLIHLNPFADEDGILRVGGRLDNAYIPFDQKHPIILSSNHRLTYLIIKYEHQRLLHAGCQAVLSSIRRTYWPLAGRSLVRKILRECVTCFRAKPVESTYVMGNLPAARVLPARPFYNCGVDYAGPFLLKEGTRARVSIKSYLCIFVCFVTKAVHIELARDLSTEAFLNCLRRFISRRGRCKNIYSDNGKNFVGAKNELLRLITSDNGFQREVTQFLSNEQIEWHFIPPYAPHFGGLWESAVKSAKFHLKRVIGETRLTYEEFYTIITQVEACLNSRPLSPLSNDPNDLTPLTPGHFLIGDSLMTFPQENLHDVKTTRLSRYQHLQQMFQHFWNRWQKEYLPQLQARHKWYKSASNALKIGAMVLIREDNIPAMQWPLGRITECHSGKDNIIRVVSVRLPRGIVKRPVSRICVLPFEQTDNLETLQ